MVVITGSAQERRFVLMDVLNSVSLTNAVRDNSSFHVAMEDNRQHLLHERV